MGMPRVAYLVNSSNSANMAVNGSVTPVAFSVKAPSNKAFAIRRLMFQIRDAGKFSAAGFGNLAGLTTGFTLEYDIDGGDNYDLLGGVNIKTNSGFGRLAYDVNVLVWGPGNDVLVSRYTLSKFVDGGLFVRADAAIVLTVRDDLTGLLEFTCVAEGQLTL